MHRQKLRLIIVSSALACAAANAQEWTSRFDLLTAGAAASVIAHQICEGADAGQRAAHRASQRLAAEARDAAGYGVSSTEAYSYSSLSYELKIKAMWQANSSRSCGELKRLRDISAHTGFDLPQ